MLRFLSLINPSTFSVLSACGGKNFKTAPFWGVFDVIDLWVSESSSSGDLGHLQSLHLHQDFRLATFRELVNFLFPSSEIVCQIKNRFGINDGHDLDISECVLNYEQD